MLRVVSAWATLFLKIERKGDRNGCGQVCHAEGVAKVINGVRFWGSVKKPVARSSAYSQKTHSNMAG